MNRGPSTLEITFLKFDPAEGHTLKCVQGLPISCWEDYDTLARRLGEGQGLKQGVATPTGKSQFNLIGMFLNLLQISIRTGLDRMRNPP